MTDISVDSVVSMLYRSVHKKEHNRKYYACNSEQLKARGISLYEVDLGKKEAAAASLYKLQPHKKIMSAQAYYDAHRKERKASIRPIMIHI